jgi:alpha-galactosidase
MVRRKMLWLLCAVAVFAVMAPIQGFGKVANMVKPEEMREKKQWAKQSLLGSKPQLPFSFTYAGHVSGDLLPTWPKKMETKKLDSARTQHTYTWTDPKTRLEVRCVAVDYADYPVVEWTLWFKNNGMVDTPILEKIQGLDAEFTRGDGGEFVLNGIKGDSCTADSYQPYQHTLGPGATQKFAASHGLGTCGSYPFYNLQMPGGGMIVVIGWPAQWASSFTRDDKKGLRITGGQELTHLTLKPGEEVRSPLMVLLFWKGESREWAQNLWRRWMVAHNLPRTPDGALPKPQLLSTNQGQIGFTSVTEENQKEYISLFFERGITLDAWDIDAGWFTCPGDWWGTGTWEWDPKRFPNGLKPVSDHLHSKGAILVTWFEPERVGDGNSWLAKNHPEWLSNMVVWDSRLLDLGIPAARQWVLEHIDKMTREQGVDFYRQDFNMPPLDVWRSKDAPDRQGIAENLHTQGYLGWWDELRKRQPNLKLDCCASGGRRNDLETLRRAVPLHRTDYVGEPTSQQGHHYGLAQWVPYHGAGYVVGHCALPPPDCPPVPPPDKIDAYFFRSGMSPDFGLSVDVKRDDYDYDLLNRLIAQYRMVSRYYLCDFYPLTEHSLKGDAWIAWQYNDPEAGEGVVQAFRREKNEEASRKIRLFGLEPEAIYAVTNVDADAPVAISGSELMKSGLTVAIQDKPGAAVILYKRTNGKKGNMVAKASTVVNEKPSIAWNAKSGIAVLTNGGLELTVETKSGLNPCSLRDLKSGYIYADQDYAWPDGGFPKSEKPPVIKQLKNGNCSVQFKGQLGSITVEQTFSAPAEEPGVILESIAIRNASGADLDTRAFKCGFTKRIRRGEKWAADADAIHFCPVPYRRETNGEMQDRPLKEVAEHGSSYGAWMVPPVETPTWGAEGWVWSKKAASFLVAKYNARGMEWSLMEPLKRGATTVLRFGGAGQWKFEHPEGSKSLAPGKSYRFGETRLQAVAGDWKQAYYAYRGYMESKNCGLAKNYDPPVQWNELYDNEYFGKICGAANDYFRPEGEGYTPGFYTLIQGYLDKYYSLDLMKGEAAKAKELGCEVLYMDPGWDKGERGGLQVWDAKRLGPMKSYVKMIRKDYGFRGIGLWCSLAGVPPTYCDAKAYPDAQVLSKDGKKQDYLICHPSMSFMEIKTKLLLELCKNGAVFLMFDSNQYSGPCYDKTHGHRVPSTREDHAASLFELARRVKEKYPHVLIEMHDPITGPCNIHYTPTYFGYGPPSSFDCLWGHEFMWNPPDDLFSRRAVSLYYFNLAYSIPFYLHINLSGDNENALVFWWFASTIRHLGVGGKSPNTAVWEAQKKAMRVYMPLKRFYTQGAFYGLDEMVHAHTLPDLKESVINVFNLEEKPDQREIRFRLGDIGLPGGFVQIEGTSFTMKGDEVTMRVSIPARGHHLVKVRVL